MSRIPRAFVFFFGLLISFIPSTFIFATVTVGAWVEDGFRAIGIKPRQGGVFLLLGGLIYGTIGVGMPAYLGNRILGLSGAIVAPIMVLAVIAWFGRW